MAKVRSKKDVLRVGIDSREQKRIKFPDYTTWWNREGVLVRLRIEKIVQTLPTGDYVDLDHPDLTIVERKYTVEELHHNLLTKDCRRQQDVWRRMVESCRWPVLLLDCRASEFEHSRVLPHPDRVLDEVLRLLTMYGMQLLWVPPSRSMYRTGDFIARWLMTCREQAQYERQTPKKRRPRRVKKTTPA